MATDASTHLHLEDLLFIALKVHWKGGCTSIYCLSFCSMIVRMEKSSPGHYCSVPAVGGIFFVVQFYPCTIFIFLCFVLFITHYHTQQQRKVNKEPRINWTTTYSSQMLALMLIFWWSTCHTWGWGILNLLSRSHLLLLLYAANAVVCFAVRLLSSLSCTNRLQCSLALLTRLWDKNDWSYDLDEIIILCT